MSAPKITWIRTPDDRKEYLSTDGRWMVSFGMGHIHPDHPRVWTLYERTGEYRKGEGESLKYTLGHHFTAAAAKKAATWTEEQRSVAYRKAQAELVIILQALRAESDRRRAAEIEVSA